MKINAMGANLVSILLLSTPKKKVSFLLEKHNSTGSETSRS
jgi:hypothetical protein